MTIYRVVYDDNDEYMELDAYTNKEDADMVCDMIRAVAKAPRFWFVREEEVLEKAIFTYEELAKTSDVFMSIFMLDRQKVEEKAGIRPVQQELKIGY